LRRRRLTPLNLRLIKTLARHQAGHKNHFRSAGPMTGSHYKRPKTLRRRQGGTRPGDGLALLHNPLETSRFNLSNSSLTKGKLLRSPVEHRKEGRHPLKLEPTESSRRRRRLQQRLHLCQSLVQFAGVFAAAAGIVGSAAAFAPDNRGDLLNDFPGLNLCDQFR
jgi:hypothetical protein